MPSKKKKYNTRFPPARIKKIMQTDEEVGKVAAAVPVIISRALELFLESLVKTASSVTMSRNAKTLTTSHVKACVLSNEKFHFLKSLVDAYPDVQVEEEFSGPCNFDRAMPLDYCNAANSSSRGGNRKPRSKAADAGPSHSATADSETCSDEEETEGLAECYDKNTSLDHKICSVSSSSSSSNVLHVSRDNNCNPSVTETDTDEDYDL